MKLEDAIKELKENPEKEFKSVPVNEWEASYYAVMEDNTLLFKNSLGKSTALYFIDFDWEWEEVKEPVTFCNVCGEKGRFFLVMDFSSCDEYDCRMQICGECLEKIKKDLSAATEKVK